MLEIRNLSVGYKNKIILKNLNLNFADSSITAVLGVNGAGKTTLFKTILGLTKPSSGEILWNGKSVLNIPFCERAKFLSYLPQSWECPFDFSVYDVVAMGFNSSLGLFERIKDSKKQRILRILSELGIESWQNRNISDLSGGQKMLVILARALAQDTDTLLLDEPTAHLDIKNERLLLSHIHALRDKTIIINIHNPSLALDYADNVVMIKNGEVLFSGVSGDVGRENLESLYETKLFFVRGENGCVIKAV